MQIRLQKLEHQQRALDALTRVFAGVELDYSTAPESNVSFDPADPQIAHNIADIQSGVIDGIEAIPRAWRGRIDDGVLGVDAKMETGTGKTLVYTQLMYELNRLYGFTKFIVIVPRSRRARRRSSSRSTPASTLRTSTAGGRRFTSTCSILRSAPRAAGCSRARSLASSRDRGSREGGSQHC